MRGSLNSLNLRDAEVAGSNPAFPTRSAASFCCPQGRQTTHRPQRSWSLMGTHGLRRLATCHGAKTDRSDRHRVQSEIQVGTHARFSGVARDRYGGVGLELRRQELTESELRRRQRALIAIDLRARYRAALTAFGALPN